MNDGWHRKDFNLYDVHPITLKCLEWGYYRLAGLFPEPTKQVVFWKENFGIKLVVCWR